MSIGDPYVLPAWLKVLMVVVFVCVMSFVVKPAAHYIAEYGGWSGFIVAIAAIFVISISIDRADAKKRHRKVND